LVEKGADVAVEERETGMRPVDLAERKAFEAWENSQRAHSRGQDQDRGQNYESIVKILEARAAALAEKGEPKQRKWGVFWRRGRIAG
jgi:hypothetical protein